MRHLPPLRLTGATILRNGELRQSSVALAGGRIARGPLPAVDLSGFLVLPGIVDLGGSAHEPLLAQGARSAILTAGRLAAAAGITTGWLTQGWSWEGGPRSPDMAERVLTARARLRLATDLRLRLRAQTHLVDEGARLLSAIRRHRVDFVTFSDETDRASEMRASDPGRFAAWAGAMGRHPQEMSRALDAAAARHAEVPRHLCTLAAGFDALGVTYGSRADADGAQRARFSMIGARVAELPLSHGAAAAARAMGDPVLAAASDVLGAQGWAGPGDPLKAGPETGTAPHRPSLDPAPEPAPRASISAIDLIESGLCGALISDRDWSSLHRAAFALADARVLPLAKAWALISTQPARLMGLRDRGTLGLGERADLVVIDPDSRRIEATFAAGCPTYLSDDLRARLMAALSPRAPIAAQ